MIVLCILVFIYFIFNITSIVNVFMLSIEKKQFQLKRNRRIISHDTGGRSKLRRKTGILFENDMKNLVNFNPTSGKSENMHFDGLLL